MNRPVPPAPARSVSENLLDDEPPPRPGCPVCGGALVEIRSKLQCARCRTICETCCEGGPG
jgi:hypothetical protein